MSSLKVLISCVFVLWFGLIFTAFSKTHEEADGIVILQSESESAQDGWSRESAISGYSGTGYLVWKGLDSFSESTAGRRPHYSDIRPLQWSRHRSDCSLSIRRCGDVSVQVYSSSALELFWNSSEIADTFYEVQRNGEPVMLGAQRSFFDGGLQPGTRYDYSILVVDAAGNVLQTESISATTQGSAQGHAEGINIPAAGSLMLTGEVYSQTAIELFWNTVGVDTSSTTAYQIFLNGRLVGESCGRSLFIDTLSAGTAYEFSIGATDTLGIEVLSNVVVLDTYEVDTP